MPVMRLPGGPATMKPKLILIADDYDDVARLLAELVECATPYEAISAKDGGRGD